MARPVYHDGDFGIDDAIALLVLTAHPDVEVVGVGSVHGNTSSPQAATNAITVLDVAGHPGIPVAVGAERPLGPVNEISGMVHGDDGLGGRSVPPSRPTAAVPAALHLIEAARAHPGELTVLATAPLTNLALAVLLEPDLPELVDRLVVMGGTLRAPGNITPWAEANVANDPEAADLVFGAGFDLRMVGLDVTMTAWLGPGEQRRLASADTPTSRFVWSILDHYLSFYESRHRDRACPLHDPTAAVLAIEPDLAGYLQVPVGVELAPTATRGMLLVDHRAFAAAERDVEPPPIRVATTLDSPAVVDRVMSGLLG